MLNKLRHIIDRYHMIQPGDRVIVAVSGGADSVALLFSLYLLREKLEIQLEAAHFNHHLRDAESDRDEVFVRSLCDRYDIPLHVGSGCVAAGEKGLEAAAREARYAFFQTLDGKIATAHTADDNAETVLMHLIRGTGLKGLGGISPMRGNVIRPMLDITRAEVLSFLEEYHLSYVTDSTNEEDAFLRNRLRHHVMPLLKEENPKLAENVSAMAQSLRGDEAVLEKLAEPDTPLRISVLKALEPPIRSRMLSAFLKSNGVREPEREHIALAEQLVFSEKPSAKISFPGGIMIAREYDILKRLEEPRMIDKTVLPEHGSVELSDIGMKVICCDASETVNGPDCFTVIPSGQVILRCRESGDQLRLAGGTKSLKKLFIDRKIPAARRGSIPVIADEKGILGVYGFGADLNRLGTGVTIRFVSLDACDRENNTED